jgi:predicted ATP-grasp superfamily ATP-dependent carboligase
MFARSAFMDLVQEIGIAGPRTEVMANSDDLKRFAALAGFPLVLKADGTSGGRGVKIVHSLDEAARALRVLSAPPTLPRAAKHAVFDMDFTLLRPSLTRRRAVVNAQMFVPGREATSALACWNGEVLASLHFEVIEKAHKLGHASVLRLVENREMTLAADRIVRRLSLSGIFGLDFMLERGGKAQLIEINPRATQVGHLTLGPGRDLPAALYTAISGVDLKPAPKVTEKDTIALFPQEWIRDSGSPFLASGYHDVPWQQPQLVQACVLSRRKQRNWYSNRGESRLADTNAVTMMSMPANEPQPICDLSPIRLDRIPNNIVNGDS